MKWVALTGGIGSGKSEVCRILRDLGVPVLDADEISHNVTGPGTIGEAQIIAEFGPQIGDELCNADGSINRGVLGEHVFGSADDRRKLESIVHPLIKKEIECEKEKHSKMGTDLLFYDIPLLFEVGREKDFDAVVVVNCDLETRLSRVESRDGLGRKEILARISSQLPLEKKVSWADYVIENSGSKNELRTRVEAVLAKIAYQPQE